MPLIGFDSGDLGGATDWGTSEDPVEELRRRLDPWRDDPLPEPESGYWSWVPVASFELFPVLWTAWVTASDERVCPECGPLDGATWEEGYGPAPPLHRHCRCQRVPAITEWRIRPATTWELRWVDPRS